MYGNKSYLIDVDPRRIYGQHKFKSTVLFSVRVRTMSAQPKLLSSMRVHGTGRNSILGRHTV